MSYIILDSKCTIIRTIKQTVSATKIGVESNIFFDAYIVLTISRDLKIKNVCHACDCKKIIYYSIAQLRLRQEEITSSFCFSINSDLKEV